MALSNSEGHLVLATGNKSELSVGYSTIYGDAVGGFAPLKDVPKTGDAELYFGPTAPPGKEQQWIKTIPNQGWYVCFRIYGPEQAAFDGSWKPGDFEVAN